MRLIITAKTGFAALAITVVAALPLYASIPRGCAEIGGQRSETGVSGRLVCTVRLSGRTESNGYDAQGRALAAPSPRANRSSAASTTLPATPPTGSTARAGWFPPA